MSPKKKIAYRGRLLLEVTGLVEARIAEALTGGVARPTALVVEAGDRLARLIARAYGDPVRLEADRSRVRRLGLRPALLWIVPWPLARTLLAARSPEVGPAPDSTYPTRGHLTVVVAAGGVTAFAILPPDPVGPGDDDRAGRPDETLPQ